MKKERGFNLEKENIPTKNCRMAEWQNSRPREENVKRQKQTYTVPNDSYHLLAVLPLEGYVLNVAGISEFMGQTFQAAMTNT